jgi:hypothetical protein
LDRGTGISGIDLRPKSLTVGVDAGLVGIHPFPAFLLAVTQSPAEAAHLVVPVGVVAWIVGAPLLLVAAIVVALLGVSRILSLLLASVLLGLRIKLLLRSILGDSLHNIFLFL